MEVAPVHARAMPSTPHAGADVPTRAGRAKVDSLEPFQMSREAAR
jgi:hypothetical protein